MESLLRITGALRFFGGNTRSCAVVYIGRAVEIICFPRVIAIETFFMRGTAFMMDASMLFEVVDETKSLAEVFIVHKVNVKTKIERDARFFQ